MRLELHFLITHNYLQNDVFLDHNMKLLKMIEMYLKYDNMHTNRIIHALNCINNHVNSCKNCMISISILEYRRLMGVNVGVIELTSFRSKKILLNIFFLII